MNVVNFYKEREEAKPKRSNRTRFNRVLKLLAREFKQDPKHLNEAFVKARTFDNLILFCVIAEEMEITVAKVAELATLDPSILSGHLREIRPRTAHQSLDRERGKRENVIKTRVVSFKRAGGDELEEGKRKAGRKVHK